MSKLNSAILYLAKILQDKGGRHIITIYPYDNLTRTVLVECTDPSIGDIKVRKDPSEELLKSMEDSIDESLIDELIKSVNRISKETEEYREAYEKEMEKQQKDRKRYNHE